MAEKDPSTPITNAIAYLDIFLEKLCTRAIKVETLPDGTLRHSLICPLYEWKSCSDEIMVKIQSDFDVKIDELLANYEDAYGLEPVTDDDIRPYLNYGLFANNVMRISRDGNGQILCKGYKIYKKKVR